MPETVPHGPEIGALVGKPSSRSCDAACAAPAEFCFLTSQPGNVVDGLSGELPLKSPAAQQCVACQIGVGRPALLLGHSRPPRPVVARVQPAG
jgi:hypothetical protein